MEKKRLLGVLSSASCGFSFCRVSELVDRAASCRKGNADSSYTKYPFINGGNLEMYPERTPCECGDRDLSDACMSQGVP